MEMLQATVERKKPSKLNVNNMIKINQGITNMVRDSNSDIQHDKVVNILLL